jgi:serine/threonine protein phosphatase PrpC
MSTLIDKIDNGPIRYGSATNIGCGHENQDNSFVWISPDIQMFGMLDGHSSKNGKHASQFAKDFCEKFIPENYNLFIENPHEFIKTLFAGANQAIKEGLKTMYPNFIEINEVLYYSNRYPIDGGSTFTMLIIHNKKVFVANVGDSSIISCNQSKEALELNSDNSPENISEFKRIKAIDPTIKFIYDGKNKPDLFRFNSETGEPEITGLVQFYKNVRKEAGTLVKKEIYNHKDEYIMLTMTRVLGDFALKPGVTSEPNINEYSLDELFNDSIGAFVLATDGLWDNWCFEDVSKFVMDESCLNVLPNVQMITDALMERNTLYSDRNFPGQGDDATIIVIFVNLK